MNDFASLMIPEQKTPYERGYEAAARGEIWPPFPRPDDSWAARLYYSGFNAFHSQNKAKI